MISFCNSILQLWSTKDPFASHPQCSPQAPGESGHFLLEPSPDGSLVAFTHWLSNTVTVLDTVSGNPPLVIEAGIRICGLRLTGDKIVAIGDRMIITWNLPTGCCLVNAKEGIVDSLQITTLKHFIHIEDTHASISPDLNYLAFVDDLSGELYICNMNSRNNPIVVDTNGVWTGFSSDGCKVWCARNADKVEQWEIIEEDGSDVIKLGPYIEAEELPKGFPYKSSHGYRITADQWMLNSSGRRLIKLPYYLHGRDITWNGKFLGILKATSPEFVILKLEV